jgi:hypothetical protein
LALAQAAIFLSITLLLRAAVEAVLRGQPPVAVVVRAALYLVQQHY